MTGKELIIDAFRLKETDCIPRVPFVGIHGGQLIGVNAPEYLKSTELIGLGFNMTPAEFGRRFHQARKNQ